MSMNDSNMILTELVLAIIKAVNDGISHGTLKPEAESYEEMKVQKFVYSDDGITDFSAREETIIKPSWFRASRAVLEHAKKLPEYAAATQIIGEAFGEDNVQHVESFANKVIHRCLYESTVNPDAFLTIVTNFLKNLQDEPVKYGANIALEGIVLRPDRIEIDSHTVLRKSTIEDLEKPIARYETALSRGLRPIPTAFLQFEFLGRYANEVQRKVAQSIAILRLFKVGSIIFSSYRLFSDSVTDFMASATLTAGQTEAAYEKCLLLPEDSAKLRKFWATLIKSIPNSFSDVSSTKNDHLTIAYNRYCDSLVHDGVLERRITNAVMGLEALFTKPTGEMQELRYRISTRASKLLRCVGLNQYEVRGVIKDAYRIRSIFAHGGQLTYDQKKRLESKYKDVKTILLSLLEYLRVTLVVMILLSKGKNELIDLIDDSLIDHEKEDQLISDMSWVRGILA